MDPREDVTGFDFREGIVMARVTLMIKLSCTMGEEVHIYLSQ